MKANSSISCPYCDYDFTKLPPDRTGCPNCGEIIYIYESPSGRGKILITEEGLYKIVKAKPSQQAQDYFTSRLIELKAAFEKAKATSNHYGELGRELEALVKNLLQEYLPAKYKVATGFVRSLEKPKWQSNQIDVLMTRSDICYPIAVHNEYSIFPLETVISFMEVTSNLTKGKLREDYEKVEELQRLHKRLYYLPEPPASVRLYNTGNHAVRPRFYYFAFSTDRKDESIAQAMLDLSNEYRIQLHSLFVLNPGYCFLMPNSTPGDDPPYQKIVKETNARKSIIIFLQHILVSLQTADFIPPNASIPFAEYYNPAFKFE